MASFCYQIAKKDGEYAIYEVYYDDDDKPFMISVDPVFPTGENITEFKEDMDLYIEALYRKILNWSDFSDDT